MELTFTVTQPDLDERREAMESHGSSPFNFDGVVFFSNNSNRYQLSRDPGVDFSQAFASETINYREAYIQGWLQMEVFCCLKVGRFFALDHEKQLLTIKSSIDYNLYIMKFAALVGAALAAQSDFPNLDSLHANCVMTATFEASCADTYSALKSTVDTFVPGPSGGEYAWKEGADNQYLWVTRTTPVKHYVDDILMAVSGDGSSCTVASKSRSETLSYYDYDTNFCNQWNVWNKTGVKFSYKLDSCKWAPTAEELADTCAKY